MMVKQWFEENSINKRMYYYWLCRIPDKYAISSR